MSEGTQAISASETVNRAMARDWVMFFSVLTFVNLTLWIETHDASALGYLEATHVLWCRLILDDVIRGKK